MHEGEQEFDPLLAIKHSPVQNEKELEELSLENANGNGSHALEQVEPETQPQLTEFERKFVEEQQKKTQNDLDITRLEKEKLL